MKERRATQAIAAEPTQLIREYLKTKANRSPEDIVLWLRKFGVEMSVEGVEAILAAIKTG